MARRRPTHASPLDRGLRIFSDVRPGEGVTAVLLALNISTSREESRRGWKKTAIRLKKRRSLETQEQIFL